MCLYHSAEKDAVFQARIRALNCGETLGTELIRLREEKAKLKAKLSEIEEVIQACDVSSGPSAVLAVARGRQILAKKGKD